MRLKQRVKALEKKHPEAVTFLYGWVLGNGSVQVGDETITREEYERRCRVPGVKHVTFRWTKQGC